MAFPGSKIIFRAYDLYEHSVDNDNRRTDSYVMAKQPDGEFGYFNTNQFALTSSNSFTGNQTINGNLNINGDIIANNFVTSSTLFFTGSTNHGSLIGDTHTFTGSVRITGSLNLIGQNTITGSFLVSGSTSQIGNNTLIGNTILSGSINISGSTTQIGNNTLIGITTLTGSILINGNIIPELSSSFDLGSLTNPWRSIYLQSGSISIQSDIPGGERAVISNANGDVTIAGAGFQIKSASAVPFNITPTGLVTINTPKSLLTTEAAVSIIGSSTGYQQPRNFTGTLLQLTAQDNQPGRISIDSFGTGVYGLLAGRTSRGTVNSPSQTKAGDTLFRITAQGWTNSNSYIGSIVRTDWEAAEDFTSTSAGTRLRFQTTPTGSTTIQTSAIIDSTGITIPSSSRLFGTSSWASNAQTASYVKPLNQNVVITGSLNVSGSQTFVGNTTMSGSLTLSSGSALSINNGFYVNGNRQFNYGQWISLYTQSGSANTAYAMKFETATSDRSGMYVGNNGSGLPTRFYVENTGLYNIQFSAQLHTTANEACDFSIWFAITGSAIANSNTDFSIEKVSGGGFQVAALNFLTPITSGSYVELYWSKTTANGQLQAKGVQSTPTRPATPSAIVTLTQIA